MRTVVLLGPQRHRPTLHEAVRHVGVEGPIAAVTAGWEEREDEIDELSEHLRRPVLNLRLYARSEQVFERDPELLAAYQRRRVLLRELRSIYRLRLRSLLSTLTKLRSRERPPELAVPAYEDTLLSIRELDLEHMARVEQIQAEFEAAWKPAEREAMAIQRAAVAEHMAQCGALALAGGHVATLLNRMHMFGVADLIEERPVFAWSAGAMVASERVVLYHDSPPQGAGDAQLLERGLELCPGVIALPHAASRLDLHDRDRVSRFARRFAPHHCITLDDASGLIWHGGEWELFGDGARRLSPEGDVIPLAVREVEAS